MSKDYGFTLPDESVELTEKEYVNFVNRIRGNFLSYVSELDSMLTIIISNLFLRDKNDFELWAKTVFNEDRTASFGTKIFWLGRIMRHHSDFKEEIEESVRVQIQRELDKIREIRNDFAHNFARNKQVEADDIRKRVIRLYDFEDGVTTPKLFGMAEILGKINDPWVLDQLTKLQKLSERIREK